MYVIKFYSNNNILFGYVILTITMAVAFYHLIVLPKIVFSAPEDEVILLFLNLR